MAYEYFIGEKVAILQKDHAKQLAKATESGAARPPELVLDKKFYQILRKVSC